MKPSSRRNIVFRLLWVILALCVLAACGYIMVNNLFHALPRLWRVAVLMGGWILAFMLILKALPGSMQSTSVIEASNFPSPALKKVLDTQEALQIGFVALDSRACVVVANSCVSKLLDMREVGTNAGLVRALHPDNAHIFKNAFQEICQSTSGTTVLKLRSFDKIQQIHHLNVALTRWKESPVAVIGMVWDISDAEQSRQETQTVKAALHDFHGVFAADGSSLLDTMRALLELGNLHFKTEIGLVAKLQYGEEKRLEVVQVLAPHEDLSCGNVFDPMNPALSHFPRALTHVSFVCCGDEALPPSVYKATRDATFLGAPIYLQRQLYGVLCYASPQDRPEGFSSGELELVQFIANWLSGEIERRQLIEDFEKKQNSLMEANASLETLLRNDLLTGLFNKSALDDRLEQEFERAVAYKVPLSVMAFSPNNLHDYRKRSGEAAWRAALEQMATTIEKHSRSFDVVARYDESTFVVVCPQSDVAEARAQAEVIQTALTQMPNHQYKFTVSVGVVSLNHVCANSQELLSEVLGACELAQLDAVSRSSTFSA